MTNILMLNDKSATVDVNGHPLYELVDRRTGRVLVDNLTLDTGYDNMLSGYFNHVAPKD